jgi:hypothetical protein
MKRIYLLMAAVVGLTSAASAQRNIDVSLTHFYEIASAGQTQPSAGIAPITDGTHILFDADETNKVFLSFDIKNAGLTANDTTKATDTLHILGTIINIAGPGIILTQNGTSGQIWSAAAPFALIPNTDPGGPWEDFVSKPVDVTDWCDSVWFTSATGDPSPISETGRTANNITCHDVTLDGWMTGVNDVKVGGNGLNVYPNPSTGNMTALFDFGNNNTGVITIADVTGKIVYTQQLNNVKGLQSVKINAGGLANGLYSLRLAAGSKIAVEKIYVNN